MCLSACQCPALIHSSFSHLVLHICIWFQYLSTEVVCTRNITSHIIPSTSCLYCNLEGDISSFHNFCTIVICYMGRKYRYRWSTDQRDPNIKTRDQLVGHDKVHLPDDLGQVGYGPVKILLRWFFDQNVHLDSIAVPLSTNPNYSEMSKLVYVLCMHSNYDSSYSMICWW